MQKENLKLYTDISGNEISVKKYQFGKGKKKLYIQGGVHGGELTYFVFEKLFHFLKDNEEKLEGIVTLVPIVNPPAWNQRIYYYTCGKFDLYKGKDWNRSYPGNETTLSAHNSQIFYNLAKEHEVAVDLHTARISKPYTIFFDKKAKELIKIFGFPYNFYLESQSKFKGSFDNALLEEKTFSFTCECGEHDSYNKENINEVFQGILNLFKYLNLLNSSDTPTSNKKLKIFTEIETLYSKVSGFTKYYFLPRQEFKKGDIFCETTLSSDLNKAVKVLAPYDGIMFEIARTHITWTGDELVKIIKKDNLKNANNF